MVDTKIPFGYHIESGRLVDVRDVPSGANCGCKCWGCDLPLIARHCHVGRVDHFAHNTRGQDKKVHEECTFSYWVSVTAMARQIFSESEAFQLAMPDYVYPPRPQASFSFKPDYVCSKACTITLENIDVSKSLFGAPFDVMGEFKGTEIAIKLIHPEKPDVPDFSDWNCRDHKAVVVAVDLSHCKGHFQHSKIPLKDALAESMSTQLDGKVWLYHPRMAHHLELLAREKQEEKDQVALSTPPVQEHHRRPSNVFPSKRNPGNSGLYRNSQGEYLFYCRRCDRQIFRNASQCICEFCAGVMYRVHRDQVNPRNL